MSEYTGHARARGIVIGFSIVFFAIAVLSFTNGLLNEANKGCEEICSECSHLNDEGGP